MFTDQEKGRILSPSTSMFRSQLVPICENLTCSGTLQCLLAWHGRIYIPGNQQMLHMIFFFFWVSLLALQTYIVVFDSWNIGWCQNSDPWVIYCSWSRSKSPFSYLLTQTSMRVVSFFHVSIFLPGSFF